MLSRDNSGKPLRLRLPHRVIVRAPGLLPMLYSPPELETELGVPARTIRDWLGQGLPYQRDDGGHIWINGWEFAAWVTATRKVRRRRVPLADHQAFCFQCDEAVTLISPTPRRRGKQILLSGTCPQCGGTVNRGIRHGEQAELSAGQSLS